MIMKIRMVDRDGRQRETMRLVISFQKGIEHHDESVVGPPSSNRIHGCHDLHPNHPKKHLNECLILN